MIFAAALLLVPSVAYVGRSPPIGGASRPCVRHSPVRAAEAASEAEMVGEWELEEREDALSAFTLIELHAGGGVDVKATSGPPPARADGRWAISPDGDIELTLTRYFSLAGKMLTTSVLVDDTDAYSTTRRYAGALERSEPTNVNGEMLMAGDEFENAFSWSALDEEGAYGKLPAADDAGWFNVGYFSMLKIPDATHDRLVDEEEEAGAEEEESAFGSKKGRRKSAYTMGEKESTRRALKEKLG